MPGYRQVDHTADLAIEVWGDSEEELLVTAARAVTDVLTGGTGGAIAARDARPVTIAALDRQDRLVQWLNEIIVAAVTDGFLVGSAEISLEGETGLRGTLRGEAAPAAGGARRVLTELKSATYHDLALDREGDGWRARVVIDV